MYMSECMRVRLCVSAFVSVHKCVYESVYVWLCDIAKYNVT